MIILYHGGGATLTEVYGPTLPEQEWQALRTAVQRLVRARHQESWAELLVRFPFALHDGTNYFGDEFSVLYADVPLEQYTDVGELKESPEATAAFKAIADTISEVGPYTRFVAVRLDTANGRPTPVAPPSPAITSRSVDEALADAEQLIPARGAHSAVDRVHTALHGYLRAVLDRAGLHQEPNVALTALFRILRDEHPRLHDLGHRDEDLFRMIMGLATVVDSLNTLRNKASLAHPNDQVLAEPEAMLAINAARSLLHYLDQRVANDHTA
jgi:hypothetical protein